MSKLYNWCLENRPPGLNGVSDSELVEIMHDSYVNLNKPENKIVLYHGTGKLNFQLDPNFDNPKNDYGSGLYLTPNLELAKEWAVSNYSNVTKGIAVEYWLDVTDLKVLNLSKMDSMYWACILAHNRNVDELSVVALDNLKCLSKKYYIDTSEYDIVVGYRADDSYFSYMRDFLSGDIYRDAFEQALALGKLGIQVCIKSPTAFSRLEEIHRYPAGAKDRERYLNRDRLARERYKLVSQIRGGGTINDVIRGENLC